MQVGDYIEITPKTDNGAPTKNVGMENPKCPHCNVAMTEVYSHYDCQNQEGWLCVNGHPKQGNAYFEIEGVV